MPPLRDEMSKKLSDELKPVFDKFDEDGSGAIDVSEMTTMIESLGLVVPPEKIKAMVDEADDDKSGEIEFAEFFSIVKKEAEEPSGGIFASIIRRLQNTGPKVGWSTEK